VIPFGPFLILGFLVGVLAGTELFDAYLSGTGLAAMFTG
jgi:prepilin signal peptidase PulO-like enzyme (type II secretory pathway)